MKNRNKPAIILWKRCIIPVNNVRWNVLKRKNENGEVVVEASIVVTLVVIIITAMLYTGMILYQQTLVSVMANQTASNIAQVYGNNLKDPFTGYVDSDSVYQSITYSNMKTDAYMNVIEQKANVFARYRLKSSRILATGNTSVEVDIVKKPNELLKSQVVVTIHDRYDIPLVAMFGANNIVEFASSGRADCVDILEYINGVEAVGNPEESNVSFLPDSDNCVITFIPNRAEPSNSSSITVLRGQSIVSSNRYTHSVMPSNPSNGTFEFDGWVQENNRLFTASTIVNDNMVVYGAWKCKVTLRAEGGKVNSQDTYTFKTRVGARCAIPNATRSGYNFNGWFTQKNGGGQKYNSNDTIINGDITLYASWSCAHAHRYESSRTGNVCDGGTIYYKCITCHVDMGKGYYGGNGHQYSWRCDHAHYVNTFSGYGNGGCGYFHYYYENAKNLYNLTPLRHSGKPWMYCQVCKYCHQSREAFWCGVHGGGAHACTPVNGHQR